MYFCERGRRNNLLILAYYISYKYTTPQTEFAMILRKKLHIHLYIYRFMILSELDTYFRYCKCKIDIPNTLWHQNKQI